MFTLLSVVDYLLYVLLTIIIVQAILSWLVAFNVINTQNEFVRGVVVALDRLTAPIYRPIRRFLPDFGGIDFTPLVVIIVIRCLQIVIHSNMGYFYSG